MVANSELEIFSDFNCIWCYFNHGELKRLKNEYQISIVWRAFPLNPDIPEEGLAIRELFGNNLEVMNDKMRQLRNKATELGLPLMERSVMSNSRLSHELEKWAETRNKGDAYHEAVYKACFADGLDIGTPSVLLDIAESIQLPREEARSVLEARSFGQAVDDDWDFSEKHAIMVAPTYILNEDKLPGVQSYEKLEALLQKHNVRKRVLT